MNCWERVFQKIIQNGRWWHFYFLLFKLKHQNETELIILGTKGIIRFPVAVRNPTAPLWVMTAEMSGWLFRIQFSKELDAEYGSFLTIHCSNSANKKYSIYPVSDPEYANCFFNESESDRSPIVRVPKVSTPSSMSERLVIDYDSYSWFSPWNRDSFEVTCDKGQNNQWSVILSSFNPGIDLEKINIRNI